MIKLFHYKLIFLFVFTLLFHGINAQEVNSKQLKRSFPMTKNGQLVVESKYGTIEVIGWSKDSVKVEIDIEVEGESDELLNRLNPTFDSAEEFLKVTALVEAKSQSYFSRLFRDINPIDMDRSEVEIRIKIHLPLGARMKLTNKFGDILVNDCPGRLQAFIAHGDIRISGVIGQVDSKIEFGLFRAYELTSAEIEIRDGTLDVEKAQHLQLTSRGSEIEVDSIDYVRLSSSKDKIDIQTIETILGEARFTDVKIKSIKQSCDLQLHQSKLTIESLSENAPTIHLEQVSSDIEIGERTPGLDISAHLEGGILRLPKQVKNLDVKVIDEKDEIRDIKGQLGSAPFSKINISGKKGTITIIQKNS